MADYPIGDPIGGPAYGEKRDPFSAAISIYTMFTAAEAGLAAMTLLEGISFAGAAISLIGNITGNKTLSSIGMIAGIAGGIGAFAEKAGLFESGNLADALGLNKGSSVSLEEVFRTAPGNQAPVVDGMQAANPMTLADTAQPPGGSSNLNINSPDASLLRPPTEIPQSGPADVDLSAARSPYRMMTGGNAAEPIALAGDTATAVPTSSLNAAVDPFTAKSSTGLNVLPDDPTAATKPTFMDLLKEGKIGDAAMAAGSGAMDMLKTNPTGAYVVSKGIGAAVDYLSGKTDAELDQLKANTGYYNAKALETQAAIDREIARRANKNMAYNTIDAGVRVKPPGLIASNMQQSTTG